MTRKYLSLLWCCVLCSFGILFITLTQGCKRDQCQTDADCVAPKRCLQGQCIMEEGVSPNDGGVVVDDNNLSDRDAELPEPPPFAEQSWQEGRWSTPETLVETLPIPSSGIRELGDTCNPVITADAKDRCAPSLLCAAPTLGDTGICQKSCNPQDANSCPPDQTCAEILSPDFLQPIGHTCATPRDDGYPCTYGQPCRKGSICVTYGKSHQGVCQKSCLKREDCTPDWCASVKDIRGKGDTACMKLIEKPGKRCDGPAICGTGLYCIGSSALKRCLQQCTKIDDCPTQHVCSPILDAQGKPLYSVCFPAPPVYGSCDATMRCADGQSCINTGPSSMPHNICLRNCTKDPKLCSEQETCVTISNNNAFCYMLAQEGQLCEGAVRCANGLSCVSPAPDSPLVCLATCEGNPSSCQSPYQCFTYKNRNTELSLCLQTCTPKAVDPCTDKRFRCIEKLADVPICVPEINSWLGQRTVGETCQPHPAAPAPSRCLPDLQCVSLLEGWTCLKTCSANSAHCSEPHTCLFDHQTQRMYCAEPMPQNQVCDVAQRKLCASGLRCQHREFSSQGVCIAESFQALDTLCEPKFLACEKTRICAGDPITPFRWTCRTSCDQSAPCTSDQTCLKLTQGQSACFTTCSTQNKTCKHKFQQCTDIQKHHICL